MFQSSDYYYYYQTLQYIFEYNDINTMENYKKWLCIEGLFLYAAPNTSLASVY